MQHSKAIGLTGATPDVCFRPVAAIRLGSGFIRVGSELPDFSRLATGAPHNENSHYRRSENLEGSIYTAPSI